MTSQQWRQAWEIFQAARAVPDSDRAGFVASRTVDQSVIDRVAAMFDQEEEEDEFSHHERKSGERVGRYVTETRIGSGSYGEVWSGRDTELGRPVALKFIAPERMGDHNAGHRLLREARLASVLNHPHIVVVHEVIASESGPVIVMELVDGAPLRSMMNADKASAILGQVLKALAF
ncbi:MAG: hypothetical protein FJW32_29020, partial [Acidobacteria bacterium]|nr:hypothetical protein [Acidobacteriota bacterium]